jgi:hypothetical protein
MAATPPSSTNSSISRENFSITNSGRNTIPLRQVVHPVQRRGSFILDPRTNIPYFSDGTAWIPLASGFVTNVCIDDADGDTSVCADTIPETDSDTIFFTTAGVERARITPTGTLAVGTTTPTAGKIAHFEGDIDVTGLVDPTGVQFAEQGGPPTVNPITEGLIYVDSTGFGPYSNTPTYVDGSNTSYPIGNLVGPGPLVTDNTIMRFDGTTGGLVKESPLTLDDFGTIANSTGNIGLDPDSGAGTVVVTGNLSVLGTTTSVSTENVLVEDNNIYLNNGYTMTTGLSGCITVNYLPTANTGTVIAPGFTAGMSAVSNPTVEVMGGTWAAGDIIQVSGANDVANDGLFEVESYVGTTLTIRGVGLVIAPTTFTFFQDQFTTDATVAGIITQVNVANMCSGTSGGWEISVAPSNDNTTGMMFVPLPLGGAKVTVGTSLIADYPTIFDACADGNSI